MKLEEWKTYRTRFLVQAKQITSTLTFVDHLGRQHCGRKGDYLVESSDGVLSIAPRRIFEDIYVPMVISGEATVPGEAASAETLARKFDSPKFETLEIERLRLPGPPPVRQRTAGSFAGKRDHVATAAKPALSAVEEPALSLSKGAVPPNRSEAEPISDLEESAARVRGRKLPQPCRDRRSSASNLGLM
jgi:hypothetical protein